jgi:hypothetical protein
MSYRDKAVEILESASASHWLKKQVVIAENRDILDMLNDIEALQSLLMLKWDEAVLRMRGAA